MEKNQRFGPLECNRNFGYIHLVFVVPGASGAFYSAVRVAVMVMDRGKNRADAQIEQADDRGDPSRLHQFNGRLNLE